MNCQAAIDRCLAQLTGDLDEAGARELESHLRGCDACRRETESIHVLWTDLEMLPAEKPSEALRARFYAMLESERRRLEAPRPAWDLRRSLNGWLERWWPRQPVVQFGFALACLAAGLVLGPRLGGRGDEIARLREDVRTTRRLVTLSMLQQTSPSERLQGVSYSYQLQPPDPDILAALLEVLDTDPNVNVRLAVVDALSQFHDLPTVRDGLVESMDQQSSPLVQVALIDLLVELHERRAAERLRRLSEDPDSNPAVRERAAWGLKLLL